MNFFSEFNVNAANVNVNVLKYYLTFLCNKTTLSNFSLPFNSAKKVPETSREYTIYNLLNVASTTVQTLDASSQPLPKFQKITRSSDNR